MTDPSRRRELEARNRVIAKLRAERDTLQAENERLREALERLRDSPVALLPWQQQLINAALNPERGECPDCGSIWPDAPEVKRLREALETVDGYIQGVLTNPHHDEKAIRRSIASWREVNILPALNSERGE